MPCIFWCAGRDGVLTSSASLVPPQAGRTHSLRCSSFPNKAENAYNWLKRKGLADKYEHAGIYCIKIDDKIVYVGKSGNMLRRIAQHYANIQMQSEKKYRILAEARRKGHTINFDVLYYAKSGNYVSRLAEIGEKEGEYIRKYQPILNTQIPKAEDWSRYDNHEVNAREILQSI